MAGTKFFSVRQLRHSVLRMKLFRRRKKLRELGKSKQLYLKYLVLQVSVW